MAAGAQLKTQIQSHHPTPLTKRRKQRRDTTTTTISVSSSSSSPDNNNNNNRKRDPPTVVSLDPTWCCSASFSSPSHHHPPRRPPSSVSDLDQEDSPAMMTDVSTSPAAAPTSSYSAPYPSSYTKFNSALNAGLLNPMSPPPLPLDKTRSSPTLFEMMANEQDCHPRAPNGQIQIQHPFPPSASAAAAAASVVVVGGRPSAQDRQSLLQERVAEIMGSCSPGNQFNDPGSGDVRLTLTSRDGVGVAINVHRQILVAHSRFFAGKLSDRWSKQQRTLPHLVEISDCDDVEVYVETLRLMYSKDLRRKLMREDVPKVLGILKVSAAIGFDAGVLSCLEYLEAAPWAEDEEEKVAALLSQLHLESSGAGEVLKRVSLEVAPPSTAELNGGGGGGEEILLRLLQVVLEGKDEKARREMKGLVSKMLRENSSSASASSAQSDLSKESLYSACDGCLHALRHYLRRAASHSDLSEAAQISRQADNLHWILDILIDRQIADEFLRTWACQADLAEMHQRVPAVHRYEVSRVTSRLFVGIGKGQVLVSKEARCMLLQTWLEPFYEDFGWMRRACKGLDRHLIEDGLANTILTLPLNMQQELLLAWFDRFLNSGDDCPNIQRGFEVWWRRAFWRRGSGNGGGGSGGGTTPSRQLRIAAENGSGAGENSF
ncbi:BTB/POZ domain-containing protein [Acorus gramineus]|uniref:BTB/POZ domain-containing protein n=1 Tax=Acorus gramineus TaxID=55184 RepID=A0AAV9AEL6_ACOGR|nr:BTB/POZ domain-containing protein [Acorus gramineus]